MLQPIMHILSSQRIILASGSPRRKQILENVGLKFEVIPSTYEENLDKTKFSHPKDYVLETAYQKTLEVANKFSSGLSFPDLIIGADTVVMMDDVIYEKPANKQHAFDVLMGFGGRRHQVFTGVILITPNTGGGDDNKEQFKVTKFHAVTDVEFAKVDPEVIQAYVDSGEPMDKAGGYGIQDAGGTLVEAIHGDYFNVMGFPLHKFAKTLYQMYKEKL